MYLKLGFCLLPIYATNTRTICSLPLVESFINEVMRYSAFASVGFERIVAADIEVDGYTLPKVGH